LGATTGTIGAATTGLGGGGVLSLTSAMAPPTPTMIIASRPATRPLRRPGLRTVCESAAVELSLGGAVDGSRSAGSLLTSLLVLRGSSSTPEDSLPQAACGLPPLDSSSASAISFMVWK